jgi:hypothetical protein
MRRKIATILTVITGVLVVLLSGIFALVENMLGR